MTEVRVDVERAALAFLLDAFRVWRVYDNFSLHFRLAPLKAIVVTRRGDADDETVQSVAKWIRDDLIKNNMTCECAVVRSDDENEGGKSDEDAGKDTGRDDDDDEAANVNANARDWNWERQGTIRSLMDDNGLGVPFFIEVHRGVKDHGIVNVFQRETKLAEEIHVKKVVKKLLAYLNAF